MKAFEPNRRILIEWSEPACPVEWLFTSLPDDATLVNISCWGFHGSDDEVVLQAIDAMGGFSLVLVGLQALLEHDVELNLVADHQPGARS